MADDYPTPDLQLEGHNKRVQRIVGNIRGAFSTTGGARPVFERLVDVEAVVRFVLLRAEPLADEEVDVRFEGFR